MSKEYKIKSLDDLFKVPTDRRRDCLSEMATAYEIMEREYKKHTADIPAWLRKLLFIKPRVSEFTWIDDGKNNQLVTFEGKTVHEKKDK